MPPMTVAPGALLGYLPETRTYSATKKGERMHQSLVAPRLSVHVTSNRILLAIRLALVIIPLALLAASVGAFWQGTGQPYPFTTLRGETVMIVGHGLYRYDTISSAAQEIGQDIVTLIIGIPLLVTGMALSRTGSLRGRLLLTGGLGYFLYTYAAMSFLTAFNSLFLVYVALFSLSLFGFILALSGIDPDEVVRHVAEHFPRRTIATYFIVVAAFLAIAWLGLVVPPHAPRNSAGRARIGYHHAHPGA
jgi:hypothetical protein